jgi:catechol 2,3-dioxygenase-like lactoylglutathione lyase family enzyme
MLDTSPLMAFIATQDPALALAFYKDILGLRLLSDEPSALVFDAHGTTLRVQKVHTLSPPPYTALGWRVSDIRAEIEGLVERGVRFERFAGFAQDESGILTFPDETRVAWFKDPDGNLLSLTQFP